ncbi:AAA family ATPase [Pandoraea sputorum]|uniref:AAA family ATPase n=1 Tax=Pandoraea sputorum TaxID=93222 RepID=UPI002B2E7AA1|nr:hypothetical protein THI4931_35370 [Pandoraea sputorum]
MPLISVKDFARELKLPVDVLRDQLKSAGVAIESDEQRVTESDKVRLLTYLRQLHGSGKPVVLTGRKVQTESREVLGKKNSVQVETRKKRVVRVGPQHLVGETRQLVTGVDVDSVSPTTSPNVTRKLRWSKLESIEISNFKAIKELSVPLSDVTILVGPNGSGKSSILQAVHWAARAASYISLGSQGEVIAFDRLDYLPSSEPLMTAHKGELATEGSPPTEVSFNHGLQDGTPVAATVTIRAARFGAGISAHIEGGSAVTPFKQREHFITSYIPGLAGLSEKETPLAKPLLRRQAAGGDAGSVLRNVLFNIASRQPGETTDDEAVERMRRLNELVQIIHPRVKLAVTYNEREDVNIQVSFDDHMLEGYVRPLETAATGVLQVVQIFAYLILFRPKLLLIDEPDAHLHPDKQERLIEALEQAAAEYEVQAILTTHSPNIVRAASPAANLLWISNGKLVKQQDSTIRTLLGWGGLDKKILFFVEDENDEAIRAILRQWPHLQRQLAICRCFGVDNLPRHALLKGLLSDNSFGIKVALHRDRDFMTQDEGPLWSKRYNDEGVEVWMTDKSDTEAYFCDPNYLATLYGVNLNEAMEWVRDAALGCEKTKQEFFNKRRHLNKILYENDGGSPRIQDLWDAGQKDLSTVTLGKTLHKALKVVVKKNGHDAGKLDKFQIPEGIELASNLKHALERLLEPNEVPLKRAS